MKFCLTSRQENEYLRKADEIRVASRDHNAVPDLAEQFPQADIILVYHSGADDGPAIETLKQYNILCKQKFIVCTDSINPKIIRPLEENNIKYFWAYPVSTPYEMQSLKNFTSVCYVYVTGPLFFQMDLLARFNIPVRAIPNVAHFNYMPQTNGVNGTWIRPEDLESYEPIVQAVEFEGVNLAQERALYRIYAEQRHWPGQLSMIITNLGTDCTNRMLPPEMAEKRKTCRQQCAAFGACTACYRYFSLADPDKLKPYVQKEENNESIQE